MGRRVNTAVWIEKYSRWQIKVQKDGIRKTFYSSKEGRTGQREANAKADAWLDDGIEVTKRITVESTSKLYMDELNLTTSKTHCIQYQYYFNNWINPKIGRLKIELLTEQHLQDVINYAYSKGISKKTLQNIRGCMLNWLKYCRKNKYTTLFPENVIIPKNAAVSERHILNPTDIKRLFVSDNTILKGKSEFDIYVNAYRFQVATGLRPGELIGLQWQDIKKDVVTLKRAINVYGEITRGKNDNARRSFKLTPLAQKILEQQKAMLENFGIISQYVFPNKYGDVVREPSYYKRWCKYRDYNKFSAPVSLYELRHTFVSVIKTLPEGYLKQIVGHSEDMDTYGIYAHEVDNDKEEAAKMIQEIFDGILIDNPSDVE